MATRFYLASSGASPLDNVDPAAGAGGWAIVSADFFRLPLVTEKSDTDLTSFNATLPGTSNQGMVFGQWVSRPLAEAVSLPSGEGVTFVVSGIEASAAVNAYPTIGMRVVSEDGETIRGTMIAVTDGSLELRNLAFATVRGGTSTGATVAAQEGDRILLEYGVWAWSSSGGVATMRFGDPSAVDDFAWTNDLTTDLCPWVEIIPTLTFRADEAPASASSVAAIPYRRRGSSWRRYHT